MGEECESKSCGCGSDNCGCGQEQCNSSSDCSSERSYSKIDMMMWLVHKAKMELIKEKMKKKLEASKGKQLDQVADLFINAMMEKYKDEAESEKRRQELAQKFDDILKKDDNH